MISERSPGLSSFVAADGHRWLFDTELDYWAWRCESYHHNPVTEEK